jgi:uncharacterized protein (TIGR03663 family)
MSPVDRAGVRLDRVGAAVVAIAALALLARLVALGGRSFHWDEGRVGYWTLRYAATGAFEYRPVAGGPFLYHATRWLFAVLPPTDAVARLVPALLGGLLPLVALLYRRRLGEAETVAVAAFLAVDPLLVYYSRFLRGDVPLAAFALVAVALAVRAADTGRRAHVVLAAVAAALAVTTSGFAVVTLGCVLVAGLLVFDQHSIVGRPGERVRTALDRVDGAVRTALSAAVAAVAVLLVFYAPRAGDGSGSGLWRPTTFPAVVEATFVGSVRKFYGVRLATRYADGATHELIPYAVDLVGVLLGAALALAAFAVVGFLRDRYADGGPRPVVAFHAYWAGAAMVALPIATEVPAPWVAVHVAAPLAIPAGAGVGALVGVFRRAVAREDAAVVAACGLVALAAVAQVGAVTADEVYGPPGADDTLVQYAQPEDLDPLLENVTAAADGTAGPDVLFFGAELALVDESAASRPPVPESWGNRLPLPWYFERAGLETASATGETGLNASDAPVIVTRPAERSGVAQRRPGYTVYEYDLSLWDRTVVVFVRE